MDIERNLDSLSLQSSDETQARKQPLKVASNLLFVYHDEDGFGNALAQSLTPLPQPSPLSKHSDSLHLPLPVQNLTFSVDQLRDQDYVKATMVRLQHLEPPTLAPAIYAVLATIADAEHVSSSAPTIIAPFLVPATKLKLEGGYLTSNRSGSLLYSIQVGEETDVSRAIAAKTQKPPPSLQIHYEPLACFLHLVRAANLPTCIIVGQRSQSPLHQAMSKDIETLNEIGELVASATGTYFHREQTEANWIPKAKSGTGGAETWRAFYG